MTEAEAQALAGAASAFWPIICGAPELVMQRENVVYRVPTTAGPHALRLHRQGYHSRTRILSELMWMDSLHRHGFCAPTPARTTDGSFLAEVKDANGNPVCASLLTWLPGQPLGASARPLRFAGKERTGVMRSIGRSLAHLHLLSDAWPIPPSFDRPSWDHDGLLGECPHWGRFWEARFLSAAERARLALLRDRCAAALAAYHKAGADYGLIHADLARENILVDGLSVCFIDYDDCGFGYRMFDLATALIKNIHEADFAELQNALLDGYCGARRLRRIDLETLPLAMLLRSLSYIGWVDARMNEADMPERATYFLADVAHLSRVFAPDVWSE